MNVRRSKITIADNNHADTLGFCRGRDAVSFSLNRFASFVFILISCLSTAAVWSQPKSDILSPELRNMLPSTDPNASVALIVRFADQVPLSSYGTESRQSIRRKKLITALKKLATDSNSGFLPWARGRGAERVRTLWLINGVALTVPARTVTTLAGWPGIAAISLDDKMAAPSPAVAVPSSPEWNLTMIKAPVLWNSGFTGQNVVVAVLDTGVDVVHDDLQNRWRGGNTSWFDPNGQHATPFDSDGHGTRVAGLIVGGAAGGTSVGVAPGARWIAAKIYDDLGYADYSDIHASLQWALDPDGNPDTDDGARVINGSWGFIGYPNQCLSEFRQDIQTLAAAGIMVVFAAGNSGPYGSSSLSPANYPESLAVGAVDSSGDVARFSSRGPSACDGSVFPELMAPGVAVRTTDLTYGGAFPKSYLTISGTSAAAPHLAGAIALLISALPGVTAPRLTLALLTTAADLGAPGPDNEAGYGLLDVAAAHTRLKIDLAIENDTDKDGAPESLDCDDHDPSIHPGATEIKHDSVDQDCNGYDLTIDITKASFQPRVNSLIVEAVSGLGPLAKLEVVGGGPMVWDRRKSKWSITIRGVTANPGTVTVSGIEGSETADVR